MRLKFLFLLVFTYAFAEAELPCIEGAQSFRQLSDRATISILTIEQGNQLYDAFGHTMIRVQDPEFAMDQVYNYGIYDFDAPNFYGKFAQGQLLYRMRVWPFEPTLQLYKEEERGIIEQTLALHRAERQKVFNFLQNNAKEENAAYYYNFFYDNCATRPLDVLENSLGTSLQYDYTSFEEGKTHRDLLHSKLPWNSWGRFLTDLPLGAVVDRPVSNKEYTFLPEWAMYAFAKAKLNNTPLVATTQTIYEPTGPAVYDSLWLTSPIVVFTLLAVFIVWVTFNDRKKGSRSLWLDRVLFIVTGVVGIGLFLLWTATDHTPTQWNYNLLWAFPLNLLAAYGVGKKVTKRWVTPYLKLLIIMLALMTFHWMVGVQVYPAVLIPLLVAMLWRYLYILSTLPKPTKGKQRLF